MTGFGTKSPVNIHDRRSIADGISTPIPGYLVGGPSLDQTSDCGNSAYPTVKYAAKTYLDMSCSYSTNEIALNWNAPLAWITEFLQSKDVEYTFAGGKTPTPGTTTTKKEEPGTTTTTTAKGDDSDADWGNVNCSTGSTPEARVDVSDAVLLARLLAQDSEAVVSSQGKLNADTNKDGSLTSNDVILILKYIARIITAF